MLVLSRKQGQKVNIGNGIEVTIVSISGNRIQLGIEAPLDVRLLRGELVPAEAKLPLGGPSEKVPQAAAMSWA